MDLSQSERVQLREQNAELRSRMDELQRRLDALATQQPEVPQELHRFGPRKIGPLNS